MSVPQDFRHFGLGSEGIRTRKSCVRPGGGGDSGPEGGSSTIFIKFSLIFPITSSDKKKWALLNNYEKYVSLTG